MVLVAVVSLASTAAWHRYTSRTDEATAGLGGKVARMEVGQTAAAGPAISGASSANTYAKPAPGPNLTPVSRFGEGHDPPRGAPNYGPSPVDDDESARQPSGAGRVVYRDIPGTPFVKGGEDKNAVSPNDVSQGAIGNCYFIAALTGLADRRPDIVERSIVTDQDGLHWVRMFDAKTGDATWNQPGTGFPVRNGHILYAQPGDVYVDKKGTRSAELWPMLFEKAFANRTSNLNEKGSKSHGYELLDGGGPLALGLFAVTGEKATDFDAATVKMETLAERISRGEIVLAGTVAEPPATQDQGTGATALSEDRLVGRHAYYVQSVDVKAKTITLQNPHGWREDPIVVPWDQVPKVFNDFASAPPGTATAPPRGMRLRPAARMPGAR